MLRNTHAKRTKRVNENNVELTVKEEGQEYAYVTKMLGGNRVSLHCIDGQTRIGHIRGAMQKKVWINVGDLVLICLRDYQDNKADIILKYTQEDTRKLKQKGELPESNESEQTADDDAMPFDFGEL